MHVFMHTYTHIQIVGVCLNLKERFPHAEQGAASDGAVSQRTHTETRA